LSLPTPPRVQMRMRALPDTTQPTPRAAATPEFVHSYGYDSGCPKQIVVVPPSTRRLRGACYGCHRGFATVSCPRSLKPADEAYCACRDGIRRVVSAGCAGQG